MPSHPAPRRGAFHIGDPATAMQRLRLHPPGPGDRTARQAVLLSTAPGSLQLLAPLALAPAAGLEAPAALAALRALQRELLLLLPQAAGLNPAAFRRAAAAAACGARSHWLLAHTAGSMAASPARRLELTCPPCCLHPPALPRRRRYAAIPPGLQGGRCFSKPLALEAQGVLDGDLLRQYARLPRAAQEGMAEAAGLDRGQLLELLQGLWRAGGALL